MSFADHQTQFRAEQRAAFALSNPRAHYKPPPSVFGCPIYVSRFVQKGTMLLVDGRVYVDSELTVMKLLLGYEPLFSRYTLGTKEAERDARRS